jgi:hypothetical protein
MVLSSHSIVIHPEVFAEGNTLWTTQAKELAYDALLSRMIVQYLATT